MAFEIVYQPEFDAMLNGIVEYLQQKWNEQVVDNFLNRLSEVLINLEQEPHRYRITETGDVREVVLTKHNVLLFRIKGDKVEVLTIFETRQNPDKKFKNL